jgi:ABC-2 type transport system permease protein
MNKVFLLTKIQLLGFFGVNKLVHAGDTKARLRAAGMGLVALMAGIMIVFFSYTIALGYACIGLVELVPAIIIVLLTMVTLFFTLIRSSGTLFGFSDYDMIMSLPVQRSAVIASRLLTVYLGNLLFGGLVFLPAMVVFMRESGSPAVLWLSALVIWLLAPLLPMIASMTIGALITAISVRFRHKNLVIILLNFGAIIGVMALSFCMQSVNGDFLADLSTQLGHAIGRFYPPAALVTAALWERDVLALIAFALLSVAAAILFVFLLSKVYTRINTALFAHHNHAAYQVTTLTTVSANKALYRRELKLLTSYPIYLINTCIGAVLMVASVLGLTIFGTEQLAVMLELPGLQGILQYMAPFFPALFVVISSTTAASLNMEGKNRWILSSLPVSTKAIFDTKILVNLTVLLPPIIVSCLALSMTLPLNFLSILMLFVTPAVYAVFIAVAGLSANLRFPKFDWQSPQQAVKQSMSVMVTTLTGFVAIAVPAALIFAFPEQSQLITVASTLVVAAITALLYHSLSVNSIIIFH